MTNDTSWAGSAPFDNRVDEDKIEKVIAALENKKYDWRTIEGIAKETSLSIDEVFEALKKLDKKGKLVQSRNPDENGRDLFTTRDYYNKSRGFLDKIRSSWADGPV